jgi:hypothetical protein
MKQQNFSGGYEGSLDMTRTDEPSAGMARTPHTRANGATEAERDSDAYLMTSPTYFLEYHGDRWGIKPSDIVSLVDQSARNAVVSVKHHESDSSSRLFYLAHHPTEVWHVTEVFSPSEERKQ